MSSDHPLLKRRSARFAIPGLHRRTQTSGGSTTSATTAKEYDPERGGYAVGIEQESAKTVGAGRKSAPHKRAQHSLLRRYPQLKEEGTYVGTWKDDKGRTHYDPAEVVQDEKEARKRAKARKQAAIWDFKNKREITL